ncbi:hypothetical protein BaRGS_00022689, partial [Batillaria attramentaria]
MALPIYAIIVIFCIASAYGGKYDLYHNASTWQEARDTCSRDGKKLVMVGGDLEHDRIKNLRPYIGQNLNVKPNCGPPSLCESWLLSITLTLPPSLPPSLVHPFHPHPGPGRSPFLLQRLDFRHFWIGLRKVKSDFVWLDSSVASFQAWGEGQPSSQSECVRYSADDFTWETYDCSADLAFMCENDVPVGKEAGVETVATGLLVGFGSMLGLLVVGFLLLQLPCCRTYTVKTIGHFGLAPGERKFYYLPDNVYEFTYRTETVTHVQHATQHSARVVIEATAHVHVLSTCEMVLKLREVKILESDPTAPDNLRKSDNSRVFRDELERESLRFAFQDGGIPDICPSEGEETWTLNVKRGFLSVFQNSMDNMDKAQTVLESDVIGECPTQYSEASTGWFTRSVRKTRDLANCTRPFVYSASVPGLLHHLQS